MANVKALQLRLRPAHAVCGASQPSPQSSPRLGRGGNCAFIVLLFAKLNRHLWLSVMLVSYIYSSKHLGESINPI
jgi:hypothetical protein